jgi:hypothetical protein
LTRPDRGGIVPEAGDAAEGHGMRLADRVAVITGAGSGIGAASAVAMAREGARVLVAGVNEAGAKSTVLVGS